jgi:quaternary ammonium compound-resistance protein SugE
MMDENSKGWVYIVIAGIFEVVWAVAMDYSNGFADLFYDAIVLVGLAISMVLLSKAMDSGLPVGTAYAVWVGIGAVGTMIVTVAAGLEQMTVLKGLFLAMIVAGIVGLKVTSKPKDPE